MLTSRRYARALLGVSLMLALLAAVPSARAEAPLSGNKPCSTVAPEAGATRFLIAGDSIVHESRGDWTWRYFLYKQLVAAGVNTDFVGDYNWLIDPNKSDWPYCDYQDPAFDTDFTASPGLKLADYNIANDNTGNEPWVQYEVQNLHADVLVMLAGANDLAKGATAAQTLAAAHQLVTNARQGNANVKIVLVATPTGGPYDNKPNASYNAQLKTAAPGWSTPNSPVVVTDPMTGWGTAARTWDQIHPNVVGEQLIAEGVADALHTMGIGAEGAPVDPTKKIGLRQPLTNATAVLNGSKVDLTWSLPVGASGVQVVAQDITDGVVGPWFQVIDYTWFPGDFFGVGACRAAAPCTSYSITTLQPGRTYNIDLHAEKGFSIASEVWAVKAGEDDTDSAASSSPGAWTFTLPGDIAPSAPTITSATAGLHQVALAWNAVPPAEGYRVSWRTGTGGWIETAAAPGESRLVKPLVAGAKYEFRVRAVNGAATSGYSSSVSAVPKANVLATPAKPTLQVLAGPKVKVTWKKVTGATRYLLQFHAVGGAWKNVAFFTTTTYTSPKLARKKSYEWRVVPYDGNVAGKTSPAARIAVK